MRFSEASVSFAPRTSLPRLTYLYLYTIDDKNMLTSYEATTLNASSSEHEELPASGPTNHDTCHQPTIDNLCSWKPQASILLEKNTALRHNLRSQKIFLNHITKFVAYSEASSDGKLLPFTYFEIVVTTDQIALLKPALRVK